MRVVAVDETQAKQLLGDLLARFTTGSILHLLADVLRDQAGDQDAATEPLRDAIGALYVLGVGLDALTPGPGRWRPQPTSTGGNDLSTLDELRRMLGYRPPLRRPRCQHVPVGRERRSAGRGGV